MLNIIVCIKQVAYIAHPIGMERKGGDIAPEKIVHMLNPYDEVAMEAAIRIKEKHAGSQITVITLGPSRAETVLRRAFAMGADNMVHISVPDDYSQSNNPRLLNPWTTSEILTQAISGMEFDIILCGRKAIDTNDGLVGSFLAESLLVAQATSIVGLTFYPEKKMVRVERSVGHGDREVVECQLPALFTVEKTMHTPRYPTLANRIRSQHTDIIRIDVSLEDVSNGTAPRSADATTLSPPRPKPKKVFVPDTQLSAAERMRLLVTGGGMKTKKGGDLIKGTPEQVADTVMKALKNENII